MALFLVFASIYRDVEYPSKRTKSCKITLRPTPSHFMKSNAAIFPFEKSKLQNKSLEKVSLEKINKVTKERAEFARIKIHI